MSRFSNHTFAIAAVEEAGMRGHNQASDAS
jgi:hypothetical protein